MIKAETLERIAKALEKSNQIQSLLLVNQEKQLAILKENSCRDALNKKKESK
jgi:hypothetical protein